MAKDSSPSGKQKNKPPKKIKGGNPFANGFVPTGKRAQKQSGSYLTKRNLLKHMLEVDITVADLPTRMADNIRKILPGWFEDVEKRFTMRQIMELVQFQLLFAKSDYVKQGAVNAIKDRVDGKAVKKLQIEDVNTEPAELVLPNGRKIVI